MPATDTELRHILADAWTGWLRPVLLLLAAALLAATYLFDWLAEPGYARLLSAVLAAVVALGPAIQAALVAERRAAGLLALALGLVWAAAWVWPTWRMVSPGDPVAAGALGRGDDLRVPSAPSSGVTLQVRAEALLRDGGNGGNVRYSLKVTDDAGRAATVQGELSKRTVGGNRGGLPDPGAARTLLHGANLHTVSWPDGAPLRVHVSGLTPPGAGELTVSVLPWALPWPLLFVVLGLALAAAVYVDARHVPPLERSWLPHAGAVTLAFVALLQDGLAPVAPVKPLFGAALVGALVGVVGGTVLSWAGRRWLGATRGRSAAARAAAAG